MLERDGTSPEEALEGPTEGPAEVIHILCCLYQVLPLSSTYTNVPVLLFDPEFLVIVSTPSSCTCLDPTSATGRSLIEMIAPSMWLYAILWHLLFSSVAGRHPNYVPLDKRADPFIARGQCLTEPEEVEQDALGLDRGGIFDRSQHWLRSLVSRQNTRSVR